MKRKSILSLKKKSPDARVTISRLDNGKWQSAIIGNGMMESLIVIRPTQLGCENETIHQLRVRGFHYNVEWRIM